MSVLHTNGDETSYPILSVRTATLSLSRHSNKGSTRSSQEHSRTRPPADTRRETRRSRSPSTRRIAERMLSPYLLLFCIMNGERKI